LLGVIGPFLVEYNRIVAGPLGLERQLAPRDPRQEVEPVTGADAASDEQNHPIAPLDVLELVNDGPAYVGLGPLAGIGGHDDYGPQHAEGDWSCHVFVPHELDRPANPSGERECVGLRAQIRPGQAGPADSKTPQHARDRGEEDRGSGDPDRSRHHQS
jgi:hypothetical protein